MSKNRAELVNDALELLIVKEIGQAADDEDYNIADNQIDGLTDELSIREVCPDIDVTDIDDVLFPYISILLKNRIAPKFGVPVDPAEILAAEGKLREISEPDISSAPLQVDYF